MTFKEVETGVWKPEKEDDEIIGILLDKQEDVGANNSKLYTLEVDKKPMAVWGSTVLDPKMVPAKIGETVKIVYAGKGEAQPGKNAPKLFKVYIDQEDEVPVEKPGE